MVEEPEKPLSVLRFDSSALTPADAYACWREELGTIFDVSMADRENEKAFRGNMETYHFGNLLLARTASDSQHFQRSNRTLARSGVDHFLVQIHVAGGFSAKTEGREFAVDTGDICIVDLSRPYATFATDFDNITLCLPRSALEPLVPNPDALHGLVLPGGSATAELLNHHMLSLFGAARRLPARDAMAVADGSVAFVAGCLRSHTQAAVGKRAPSRAVLHAQVRRFIESNLSDPDLGPEQVVAAVGVSRATLFRMFEALGGVASYIRGRRLANALADLRRPVHPERVIDIAYKWGFRSEASFSRAFRAAYGLTPSDARMEAAAGLNAAGRRQTAGLSHWVRGLAKS